MRQPHLFAWHVCMNAFLAARYGYGALSIVGVQVQVVHEGSVAGPPPSFPGPTSAHDDDGDEDDDDDDGSRSPYGA